MKMKAVNLESPYTIGLRDIPEPNRKAGEALLKIKSAGICGSDIGAYRGTNKLVSYPRIIGHELAGEVVEIDANAKGIKPGDRVIVDPYLYCGTCYPCSIGRTNCCENLQVLGVHIDGGMAEYITHPDTMLIKAPVALPWELIPLAEPLTIALHAIHRTGLKAGEHVAINGAGAIGLLIAQCAMAYGAIPILIDMVDERLEFARTLGVQHTIQLGKLELLPTLKKITNGRLAEVVVEASGANSAIRSTLDMVSFAGRIALTGWPKNQTELPTDLITKKEIDIYGSRTSVGEFEEALELIVSHKVDAAKILSKVVSLAEVPEMVREQSENPGKYLKINILIS
jgi:L-gulonate 5-dehydrogenase